MGHQPLCRMKFRVTHRTQSYARKKGRNRIKHFLFDPIVLVNIFIRNKRLSIKHSTNDLCKRRIGLHWVGLGSQSGSSLSLSVVWNSDTILCHSAGCKSIRSTMGCGPIHWVHLTCGSCLFSFQRNRR